MGKSNGAIHSALIVAIENNADLQRWTTTGRTQLCANATSSADCLQSTGNGRHALNVSDGRSVKAARSGTQGATVHTQYRGMTETRGARVHGQAKSMIPVSACGE
ncbi:hypothetical protein EXN66_Car009349 [Channa argus]|uniref:Uncharacterized protein n=1 Tax=Channa argus TaxID=215402 RepID=A0A6G1PU09_CHAAH|nr:hypothetical protein EXN66_Car009349 [Channa argus]KAK2903911.1 hypothetical protein Q8A73_010568 [Channa argus]